MIWEIYEFSDSKNILWEEWAQQSYYCIKMSYILDPCLICLFLLFTTPNTLTGKSFIDCSQQIWSLISIRLFAKPFPSNI